MAFAGTGRCTSSTSTVRAVSVPDGVRTRQLRGPSDARDPPTGSRSHTGRSWRAGSDFPTSDGVRPRAHAVRTRQGKIEAPLSAPPRTRRPRGARVRQATVHGWGWSGCRGEGLRLGHARAGAVPGGRLGSSRSSQWHWPDARFPRRQPATPSAAAAPARSAPGHWPATDTFHGADHPDPVLGPGAASRGRRRGGGNPRVVGGTALRTSSMP